MKIEKKETGDGVAYARKEAYEYDGKKYDADIKHGDTVEILDAGIVESHPQYGNTHKFLIKTRNGDKRASFNQSSLNLLVDEFGDDSETWKGKKVNVLIKKTMIANERRIVAYFVTNGWSLDDYGDLVKEGANKADTSFPEEEINPEDIPF